MKNWKVILAILTTNVILMASGYTMLIPFLPMYLMKELGVAPEDVKIWTGAVFSITFLIGGIMAPIWGRMADTKGKKLMALRSSLGLGISYFLGGMVASPEQMFLVRVLQGFAAGLWSVSLAIATSTVPMEKLGISLGIMQAGLTAGNVLGPLIGGTLASLFGMRTSFYVAGTLLTLITVIFYFYVPEPPRGGGNKKAVGGGRQLLRNPKICEGLLYACLVQMVVLLIQPILSLYVAELNHTMDNIIFLSGLVFSLVGIASAITAPMWGRFGQDNGFYKALALAACFSALVIVAVAYPDTLVPFASLYFVYGLFFAGIAPSISAILASQTEQNQRGQIFGYMFSAQQFGSMVGPLLGGLIATYFPLKTVFYASAAVLFIISALVYRRHRQDKAVEI